MSSHADRRVGLRERKKAKTRAAIQAEALRLFREQGYDATTIEQIAEAAEVSESTLFRYFPTKEELVLWDEFDPLLIEAFRAQPPEVSPLPALHSAFRTVFEQLSPEQWDEQRERTALILTVPDIRGAVLDQLAGTIEQVAELVAERAGRRPEDLEVRTFAGAVIGAMMAVMLPATESPDADWFGLIDAVFAHLQSGLQV